jgi:hypothetical protein
MSHRVLARGREPWLALQAQGIGAVAVNDYEGSETPFVGEAASASPPPIVPAGGRRGGRPRKLKIWERHHLALTRGGAARELGVNVSTVRRMEVRGELVPEIDENGIRWFSYYEVRALKQRRVRKNQDKGAEIQIAAFELFRKGVDWRDVTIRLRYDPRRVYRLWQLYSVKEEA